MDQTVNGVVFQCSDTGASLPLVSTLALVLIIPCLSAEEADPSLRLTEGELAEKVKGKAFAPFASQISRSLG